MVNQSKINMLQKYLFYIEKYTKFIVIFDAIIGNDYHKYNTKNDYEFNAILECIEFSANLKKSYSELEKLNFVEISTIYDFLCIGFLNIYYPCKHELLKTIEDTKLKTELIDLTRNIDNLSSFN